MDGWIEQHTSKNRKDTHWNVSHLLSFCSLLYLESSNVSNGMMESNHEIERFREKRFREKRRKVCNIYWIII